MKAVAQPDQGQSDDVMQDQLFEILARFLEHQQQHNGLLGPITRLQQVIRLEQAFVRAVGETLKHGGRVEIPDWRSLHDVQTKGAKDCKVDGRVELLHESGLLCFFADAQTDCQWADHALHQKLSGKGQDDGVESHKSKIGFSLAVLGGLVLDAGLVAGQRVISGERVAEEDAVVKGIRG